MSRHTGDCFVSGVNVNLWKRRRCVRGLVYVWSLSRMGWYMVLRTCGWNVVLVGVLGVLATCVRGPCGGLWVGICLVGVPCVGSLCVGMCCGVN